jgi:hypothetical protein
MDDLLAGLDAAGRQRYLLRLDEAKARYAQRRKKPAPTEKSTAAETADAVVTRIWLGTGEGLRMPWTQQGTLDVAYALTRNIPRHVTAQLPILTGYELTAAALEWLTADAAPMTGQVQRPQEVTESVLPVLESRVAQLRDLDDKHGGPLTLEWIGRDLCWVAQLVHDGTYSREIGIRLHLVLAELAQLGGWLACDQGLVGLGQRYFLAGLHAAHTADDRAIGANILSCLSYQFTWAGAQRESLLLIKAAILGARDLETGRVHALLSTREARAHAQLNDADSCARALEAAAEALERSEARHEPRWVSWVTPAVLMADAGRAWLELNRPDRAEHLLQEGLTLFSEEQPRNRMLHLASLAEARLALGNLDGAAAAAHDSLDLCRRLRSGRARSRLRQLQKRFAVFDSTLSTTIVERTTEVLAG